MQRESTLSSTVATDLLQRLANLNVDRSHGQRKPHKPLSGETPEQFIDQCRVRKRRLPVP